MEADASTDVPPESKSTVEKGRTVFDLGRIEGTALEAVIHQMSAAAVLAEVPSGKIVLVNERARRMAEWNLGRPFPQEPEGIEDFRDLRVLHPDGRLLAFEELPLMRSIATGEEVADEEYVLPLDDGTRLSVLCSSSPVRDGEGRMVAVTLIMRDVTEQKRSEEYLARCAAILEATPDFVATADASGRVLSINRAARRVLGIGEDEDVSNTNIGDYFPEWARKISVDQGIPAAVRDGAWSGETALLSRDGREIPTSQVIIAHKGSSGEVQYLSTISRDITERKRAEESLRESNRRTEDILESITDAFWAVDRDWRFTYVNERTVHIFSGLKGNDFTREQLVGQSVWEVFPNIVGTLADEKYHQAVAEQEPTFFEYHYPGEGVEAEERPWFEIHLYPSRDGLSVYYQDITERKRAEKETETRTRQQAVLAELGLWALAHKDLQSLMDDAVALVAQTLQVEYSKIVELLPSGEELLLRAGVGWREGLVGSATEGAGLDSQAGYTLRLEEPVIVEDLSTETRFRPPPLLHEHGVVSSMTVVIAGRGGPFGVLGAHAEGRRTFSEDDVNFLQAVANVLALRIEREEAEEKTEEVREAERTRIARDLHDEALQDLTYALAEAQLLRSISTEQEAARRAERIVAALDRMGPQLRAVIYDLRLEGEQDKPFSELLGSLLELQRTMAPDGCEINLDLRDGVLEGPLGQTGREVLRIVGEAVTNARRHSGAENVRVAVWTSEDENDLWVEVSDDGQGFDPGQEEPSTTGGTGTKGMRERARILGGNLKIESEPGKGTRVRLELGLKKAPEEEPEERVRILLVDDHASVREALASTFEGEGFEIVGQAGSLAEARTMLEEEQQEIDVAVVDLGLPDGYGADLIKELREKNPQAQSLVLSASLDRANTAVAVQQGAAGVLNKTAHLDEVVEAVRRLRRGETLMPLEEVVGLLRFAGSRRTEEHEARQAIEKLTPREKEVLQALADGLDSEGIAQRLHISLRTERNHISSILAKLGVHSQLQALVFALRHGVVEIR